MSTLPGMVSVLVAAVAAAIGGLAAFGFGAVTVLVLLTGIAFFVVAYAVLAIWGPAFESAGPGLESRFPTPKS